MYIYIYKTKHEYTYGNIIWWIGKKNPLLAYEGSSSSQSQGAEAARTLLTIGVTNNIKPITEGGWIYIYIIYIYIYIYVYIVWDIYSPLIMEHIYCYHNSYVLLVLFYFQFFLAFVYIRTYIYAWILYMYTWIYIYIYIWYTCNVLTNCHIKFTYITLIRS